MEHSYAEVFRAKKHSYAEMFLVIFPGLILVCLEIRCVFSCRLQIAQTNVAN